MKEVQGPRRVVAGLDEHGRSCVVADSRVEVMRLGEMSIAQPWRGAIAARVDSQAPLDEAIAPFRFEQMAEQGYAMMVAEYAPGQGRDDPGMHFTDTADHLYMIEGEVTLVLETGSVTLRAGDVGVIRGVVHGWRNETDATARLVTFVLSSTPAVAR